MYRSTRCAESAVYKDFDVLLRLTIIQLNRSAFEHKLQLKIQQSARVKFHEEHVETFLYTSLQNDGTAYTASVATYVKLQQTALHK